jgi:Ser/Thr protein kinase RdoA (MazF antagonist)
MTLPFATLTPDCLLSALESIGLLPDGRLLALNSYENRVYQVGMDEGPPLVVKFYRPDRWPEAAIREEQDFSFELSEREIPVVSPMRINGESLHRFETFWFAVFPRRGGRAPELSDPATLQWLGRFIARIHAVGAIHPFKARPAIDIQTFGTEPVGYVLSTSFVAEEIKQVYAGVAEQALAAVRRCYERAGSVKSLRLHGDCHPGNILWTDEGPHFVDLDDARMGPAIQDLWMLLSGEREERSRQLGDVMAGYEDFCEFDMRELHLIEALRTLRLIHYSAWIARRWDDPAFPAAFPWFGQPRYWQDRILELREQIALMDEPPLWSS